MRSELKVTLDKPQWTPGEPVTGRLIFAVNRALEVKGVEARFEFCEVARALVLTSDSGPGTTGGMTYQPKTSREVLGTTPLQFAPAGIGNFEPREYPAGAHSWSFSAPTPSSLPGSVEREKDGERLALEAAICIKVAVAWGFDHDYRVPLRMVVKPRTPGAGAFRGTRVERGTADAAALEIRLSATEVARGGVVSGLSTFRPGPTATPQPLRARLIEQASGQAGQERVIIETVLGEAAAAETGPFMIPVPSDIAPSYEGRSVWLRHVLEVEADLGARAHPKAGITLRIV